MADRLPFLLLLAWIVVAPVFLGSVPEAVPAEGPIGSFIGAGTSPPIVRDRCRFSKRHKA